jgi:excisionase family DNA binding protein
MKPTNDHSDELITPSEAARVLGVSADTVRAWSDAGQLRCLRTRAGHRLYRLADVDALKCQREDRRRAGEVSCWANSV